MNPATDPEPSDKMGDPEPPDGKINPPTGSQPTRSQNHVGVKQQPETATDAADDPEQPASRDSSQPTTDPIIITGG